MKSVTKIFLLFSALFVYINQTKAAKVCTQSGPWNDPATWGGGAPPVAGDDVQVYLDRTVTVTADAACASLWVGVFSPDFGKVVINSGVTLTCSGATNFGGVGVSYGIVDMSAGGTFICATWSDLNASALSSFIPGTNGSTVRFTGNFTLPDYANYDEFNNLEIAAGANTVTLSRAITVTNDLTLTSGTLNAANLSITVNGDWTNAGGAFTEGTGTVTFNGTGTQTITGAETFYNLITNITSTGILTLATADVTVSNALTMTAGLYNLNGRTLTLGTSPSGNTSTLTHSAGTWMYGGTFKRFWPEYTDVFSTDAAAYGLFPMGTSAASTYRPVEINTTTTPTIGTDVTNSFYTVNHVDNTGICDLSPYTNDGGTDIQRIHNAQFITAITGGDGGGVYNINVTMTDLLLIGNVSDIRLAKYSSGGPYPATCTASVVGTHAAATGTTANPTAKRTGLNTEAKLTGDFRISSINASVTPLPVELISFDAACENGTVKLTWTTASEMNNNYFIIERGTKDEGQGSGELQWEVIGKKNGAEAGNSSTISNYEFIDSSPEGGGPEGALYYRLKQIDYNGQDYYFSPVTVKCYSSDIATYPTVSSGLFFIRGDLRDAQISAYNVEGEKVYSLILRDNDERLLTIHLSSQPNSIYFLNIKTPQEFYTQRLIIQK